MKYCAARGIGHKRLGKLIVATSDNEAASLEGIATRAATNGVDDLQALTARQAQTLEPALSYTVALLSPSTGVVNNHALMLSYQGEAENAGAQCVFHTPMLSARVREAGGFEVDFGGPEAMTLSCNVLINSAGLHARPHSVAPHRRAARRQHLGRIPLQGGTVISRCRAARPSAA